jgi:hypothetical protein
MLFAAALVLILVLLVMFVGITVQAVRHGRSIRGRVLPDLSAADRRRARRSGIALAWVLWLVLLVLPWLPRTLLVWGPPALAVALGTPLWVWWVTRLASRGDA